MKSNLSVGLVTAAEYTPCFAWSIHPHRASSDVALEAILARGVDVARHRAFAESREAHPVIEPVRVLEARVRPEAEPDDALCAAPPEGFPDQRLAQATSAERGVEIKARW